MSNAELAQALMQKADQGEYVQIRNGVYFQTGGDLHADNDMRSSTLRDHRYWIICAPNFPVPVDTRLRLEELIELYDITEDEIYF